MFIGREDAQHIVDEMKTSIHRDINIMDGEGVILASTNPARQGKLHQGALRIIREGLPGLTMQLQHSAHPNPGLHTASTSPAKK